MQQRNSAVDCAKYIAALLVVAIHTAPFTGSNEAFRFFMLHVLCRVAVPFFVVCTGYYLTGRLTFDGKLTKTDGNRRVFLRQLKKLLWLYGVWTVLYLFYSIPMWIEIGWFSFGAFVDYGIATLTQGSHYHFWYLWGMICTLPVFYVLLRVVKPQHWKVTALVLWIVEVILYAYGVFLPGPVAGVLAKLEMLSTLFRILPLLLVGCIIRQEDGKPPMAPLPGFCLSFLLLTAEAFLLRSFGAEAVSYLVFTLPAAYFLFCLILRWRLPVPASPTKTLGALSIFVYCVHPMLVETTDALPISGAAHFAIVAAGSTALGLLWLHAKKIFVKKRNPLCSN